MPLSLWVEVRQNYALHALVTKHIAKLQGRAVVGDVKGLRERALVDEQVRAVRQSCHAGRGLGVTRIDNHFFLRFQAIGQSRHAMSRFFCKYVEALDREGIHGGEFVHLKLHLFQVGVSAS